MCKHLRTGGMRVENGYEKNCLVCGHEWFEKDKPQTAEDKADRESFEHNEQLKQLNY